MTDSRETSIYLLPTAPNENKRPPTRPITVGKVGGSTLTNSHEFDVLVKSILKEARTSHILPGLKRHSLIDIAPLFDAGFKVLFANQEVIVKKITK